MKHLVAALFFALSAGPVLAQSVDISSVFPPVTYPEPVTDTVTQGDAGIDK